MDYFFLNEKKKMEKKLRIIYGGFWFGFMNFCNKKLVHMMLKTN
jgi:hypothetical protein